LGKLTKPDDDLADMIVFMEVPKHIFRLGEVECRIDDRLDFRAASSHKVLEAARIAREQE
jgi:hypothetical protein